MMAADPVTLGTLLGRIADELSRAALDLAQVGTEAGPQAADVAWDASAIVTFQAIDSAEQTVRTLAGVLSDVSRLEACRTSVDAGAALAHLPLAALAGRLRGTPEPHLAVGGLDLFC